MTSPGDVEQAWTPVQKFERNELGRDFAVGDVHGAFTALRTALTAIGFDRQKDRLFSVGDLVDRGAESAQVTDWLDEPWFQAVSGNHDLMAWRAALGQTFPQVDHVAHGGGWLQAMPAAEQERIGRRLAALPVALEVETPTGKVGIVHADFPSDDWHDLAKIDWNGLDRMDTEAGQCLWSVERYARRYPGVIRNIRAVVHGHMTVAKMVVLGNAYFIDTGGWRSAGRFTFLNLATLDAVTGPGAAYAAPNLKRYR